MIICDRCNRNDTVKVDVMRVCVETLDKDMDCKSVVPDMELCKRCRAELRMTVLAWLDAVQRENAVVKK